MTVTADDELLLQGIEDAPDLATARERLEAYYRDRDRADRTPREILYLHMGLLSGGLKAAIDEVARLYAVEDRVRVILEAGNLAAAMRALGPQRKH